MSTLDQLSAWIPQVQSQYIEMDGAYGAQCWDLHAHWAVALGLPIINTGGAGRWPGWAGNMVDAFPQSPEIAAAYELVGPDQPGLPGDTVVWDDSYWYYPKTHVAVLVRDTRNGWLTCMSQNSTPSQAGNPYPGWTTGPTTLQTLPRQGLIGFIRPRTGINYQGTITPQEDDVANTDMNLQENTLKVLTENKTVNGELSIADALETLLERVGGIPHAVLFGNRVEGRNIVDTGRQSLANDAAILGALSGLKVGTSITAADIAAAIPKDIAKQVADLLAERLAA